MDWGGLGGLTGTEVGLLYLLREAVSCASQRDRNQSMQPAAVHSSNHLPADLLTTAVAVG